MTKKIIRTSLLLLLFTSKVSLYAQDSNIVPGNIIIMAASKEALEYIPKEFSQVNGKQTHLKVKSILSEKMYISLFEFDYLSINPDLLLQLLQSSPLVKIAQFNHIVQYRNDPLDSLFSSQWNLNNTGQNSGLVGADIDALNAWDITTGGLTSQGDTIVVAVVDAGFDLTHEDLNFWKNYHEIPNNNIDDDNNGYKDDFKGWNNLTQNDNLPVVDHGTHVSGIIGAKGGNIIGVSGVNWNVKVMAVSTSGNEADVIAGYSYVLEQRRLYNITNGAKGAFVVSTNSSFGLDLAQPSSYPLWCAMYDSLGKVGILSVAATADNNYNVDTQGDMPTACPSNWLVTVTSTNNLDAKPAKRGYGATTIDLAAPGESILSTFPSNSYSLLGGTSMASPHVAGAIALMYSVGCHKFMTAYKSYPDSIALIIKNYLLSSTDKLSSLNGITLSGGRLNIYNAVKSVLNLYSNDLCINKPAKPKARYQKDTTPFAIFNLYPNPTYTNPISKTLNISFNSFDSCSVINVKIISMLGVNVKTLEMGNSSNGEQISSIDISELNAGIYFLQFSCNSIKTKYWKLVVW